MPSDLYRVFAFKQSSVDKIRRKTKGVVQERYFSNGEVIFFNFVWELSCVTFYLSASVFFYELTNCWNYLWQFMKMVLVVRKYLGCEATQTSSKPSEMKQSFHWKIFLWLTPAHSGQHPSCLFRCVLKGDVIRLPGWRSVKSLGPREVALCHAAYTWWWREQAEFTLAWTRPLKQLTAWLLVWRAASVTYQTWKCVPSSSWMGVGEILTLHYTHLFHPSFQFMPTSGALYAPHDRSSSSKPIRHLKCQVFFVLFCFVYILLLSLLLLLEIRLYH